MQIGTPFYVKIFFVEVLREPAADISDRIKNNDYHAAAFELGHFETPKGQMVGLYEVHVPQKAQLHRNRKALRDLLANVYRNDVDAALIVFVQDSRWRFTYVSEIAVRDEATGKRVLKSTDPKRYTYLFGEGEKAKTAATQFSKLKKTGDLFKEGLTLDALQEAFNVEKMSKAFFNEYRKHYGYFTAYLTGEDENTKSVNKPSPFLASIFNGDKKNARDFVKKLLGRIVFMYFLEKKGWLGVPQDKSWGEGDENFLSHLFQDTKHKEAFYSNVLVPLFYETLNTDRKDELFKIDKQEFSKGNYHRLKIPFLNGGLFENDMPDTDELVFPEQLFQNLFLFFDQYNFTVYEDSPDEHTVAVDPEMLGHIFENLLEDNKDKGAYYTPKEIVHYMCQESLIEYLYTKLNPESTTTHQELGKAQTDLYGNGGKRGQLSLTQQHGETKEKVKREWIEQFIKHQEAANIAPFDREVLIALRNVKVCDPAIGSGAFPMGILMEIFHAVQTLFDLTHDTVNEVWKLGTGIQFNAAKVKSDIIQNSVYGVDIEKGAVDIARLRFWLSLVVDETKPQPLPNLDYKIVVGNSLLSKFEDEVIDIEWNYTVSHGTAETKQIIMEQVNKLINLGTWQNAYYIQKGNKQKAQLEIRNLKIDILINQLTLNKISFQQNNPKLGGFAPTAKQIQKNLENQLVIAGYDKNIKKLQAIKSDKDTKLEFFDWKLDFPEVMNEKVNKGETGFDIVIGNPPYIQLQSNQGALAKSLQNQGYETFERTGDIYTLFYEKGYQLLKRNGNLIFITSNKWMRAGYGESTRNFFATKTNPILLIDFAGQKIFDAVTVDTNILLFQKAPNQHKTIACTIKENCLADLSCYIKQNNAICSFSNSNSWVILNPIEQRIKEKIERIGTPLKDWDINIYRGVLTGYNEAFIIDGEKRNELIKQDPKSAEIIRPVLRGRDIKRYGYEFADLYLITTFPSLNIEIENYPAIKQHLLSFGYDRLKQTGEVGARKRTNNRWFETQDSISYWDIFHWQSNDLIHWEGGPIQVVGDDKKRAWAPEFVYERKKIYFMFSGHRSTMDIMLFIIPLPKTGKILRPTNLLFTTTWE